MQHTRYVTVFVLMSGALALSVWAAPAPLARRDRLQPLARSWPMFGGTPARNMANPFVRGVVEDFCVTPRQERNVRWSVPLGGIGLSSPAVSGGRVYVGANNAFPRDPKFEGDKGVMLCLDATTGRTLWQITHDKLTDSSSDRDRYGIVSGPCVNGGRVYYVSNRAEVVCARAADGKVVWSFDMIERFGVFPVARCSNLATGCSPLVFGGAVFVVTGNGVDENTGRMPSPQAPAFLALDKDTGKVLWRSDLPNAGVMCGQFGSPAGAVFDGRAQVLFPGGDGWLYSLDPDTGALLWKFDLNPKKATPYKPGGGGEKGFPVLSAPVVHDGKAYVAIGQEPDAGVGVGHLWCIDITKKPANKEKDLSPVGDNFDPKAPANKDSGLVWHYGGKTDLPKNEDGPEFVFGRSHSTVAVQDGLLYVTECAGYLHCLEARTGHREWVYDLKDETRGSPYYAEGKVFVGTSAGDVCVFRHGRATVPPHKIDMKTALNIPPVAADGVLYLNAGQRLYALARP